MIKESDISVKRWEKNNRRNDCKNNGKKYDGEYGEKMII